jgi:hypothetical protein
MEFAQLVYDGRYGGRRAIWSAFRVSIANLIEKFKIQPMDPMDLPQVGAPVAMSRIRPWPCGGIKYAHVHFRGDVYPLDAEQWRVFTDEVVRECMHRLENAQTVSLPFDMVADIGEMAGSLTF